VNPQVTSTKHVYVSDPTLAMSLNPPTSSSTYASHDNILVLFLNTQLPFIHTVKTYFSVVF
jgi:hypothetical protein